jgi:LytS/YehU family sensor histidine kinase
MTAATHQAALLALLGIVAIVGIVAGVVLAGLGYSSAGAFAVSSGCVGVLGTLATEHVTRRRTEGDDR